MLPTISFSELMALVGISAGLGAIVGGYAVSWFYKRWVVPPCPKKA